MADKMTREKLQVLIPHWLEHNHGHGHEFRKWADTARQDGLTEVAELINKAIGILHEADALLAEALVKVGGPTTGLHQHHHEHHHHDE